MADNGIDMALSVIPDPRIPVMHEELRNMKAPDFETVIQPGGIQSPRDQP